MDVPRSAKTSRPRPVSSARLRLLSGAPAAVASRTGAASSPVRPNARLQPLAERRSATAGGSGGAPARVRARAQHRAARPAPAPPAAPCSAARRASARASAAPSIPFSTSSHHGPRAAPAPPRGWPGARPPARYLLSARRSAARPSRSGHAQGPQPQPRLLSPPSSGTNEAPDCAGAGVQLEGAGAVPLARRLLTYATSAIFPKESNLLGMTATRCGLLGMTVGKRVNTTRQGGG